MNIQEPSANTQTRLESWKEIGAYLQRDSTTARRWEKEEGLPVHRHSHKSRSSVYAYPSEIDAWRATRKVALEPAPARPLWKIPAFALTMLLCLVMVGNGVRPVSAQQASMTARQIWANAEGGGADSISPDGRLISFVDWESGNLAVRDLPSGSVRRLTNTGGWKSSDPGWVDGGSLVSPDGSQVAYNWWDNKTSHDEIRIVSLHGTEFAPPQIVRQNKEDEAITPFGWSPDGKQLYVERRLSDRTTQLAVVSIQGGTFRVLTSMGWLAAQARLSPDGRYIAYDRPTGDAAPSSDIVILATDGSQESVVVDHPAKDFSPMWSPDGRHVLFLSDRTGRTSLWSVPVENGKSQAEPEMVKADVGQMLPLDIARDGTLYYMVAGKRRNIHFAELDGTLKVAKPPVPAAERFLNGNFHPSWSPDGEFLAYYSAREGAYRRPLGPLAPENATVLVVRTVKTGEERDIRLPLQIPAYPVIAEPKWFPDGHSVLVVGWVSRQPGFGYFRVDLASGKTELLHRPQGPQRTGLGPGRLDLSPDGKSIYYLDGALRRFDIDTGQDTEVRKMVTAEGQLAISPDGKLIALAYRSADAYDESIAIYIAVIAGGEPRLVYQMGKGVDQNSFQATLTWTKDQRYLLFGQPDNAVKPKGSALWRIPVAGGEPEKLGISLKGVFKTPRIHPDGRRIAYESIEGSGDEVWALGNFLPEVKGK